MTTKVFQRQKPRFTDPPPKIEIISHAPNVDDEIPLELPPQPLPRHVGQPMVKYDFQLPKISDEVPEPP